MCGVVRGEVRRWILSSHVASSGRSAHMVDGTYIGLPVVCPTLSVPTTRPMK